MVPRLPISRGVVLVALTLLVPATAIFRAGTRQGSGIPEARSSAKKSARPSPAASGDLDELIRIDPVEALRIAGKLAASRQRDDLLRRAIAEWSTRNGRAALRWISENADPALRDELRSLALVHFADRDPAAAAEVLTTYLPHGPDREQALLPLYQRWAQLDPAAARASAKTLTDSNERIRALEQVVRQLASDDPPGAIRTLFDEGLEESSPDLIEELTARWAVLDRTAAHEWLDLQPAGELRDRLVKQLATVAARQDPQGAAALVLESIPPGMTQDEAILAVLGEWLLSDVDAAGTWAATFPAGALRRRAEDEVRMAMQRRGAI